MEQKYDISSKRIIAFIVDFFIVAIIQALGFWYILLNFLKAENLLLLLFICTGFVSLLLIGKDAFGGQSIGKRILKIGVREMGDEAIIPSVGKLLLRNVFLVVWPIELFVFFSSKKKTRWGDKLLGTIVIGHRRGSPMEINVKSKDSLPFCDSLT